MDESTGLYVSLHKRVAGAFAILLIVVIAATWITLSQGQRQIIEYQAMELAEVVARQATVARSVYAEKVVGKLHADGFGAHLHYNDIQGFVPLPAQFLKMIGSSVRAENAGLYRYKPISKWNLEETQGIRDDFQRWAWAQLEAQDRIDPAGPIDWQPAWRIEDMDGVRTLRYLRADPAKSPACVECHNTYERTAQTRERRLRDGIEPGKQWQLHQLMGAIEVNLPIHKVEAIAKDQTVVTFLVVIAVVVTGMVIISIFLFADVTRARSMARELSWQAGHDSLTGLVNRRTFEKRLSFALERAKEDASQHALMFMDLDQFKLVNDTCGHIAGDELLRQLSGILKAKIRANDTLARLGGDEFAVLLENCPLNYARTVAENIRRAVREFRLIWGDRTFEVGASIGVMVINADSDDAPVLMSTVDVACYMAKDQGRNRVRVITPGDTELSRHRNEIEWVSRIQKALEDGRMRLAVQEAATLQHAIKPQHYRELLLRMVDEEGQPVRTDMLISSAERYNLMPRLDRWVFSETLALMAAGKLPFDNDSLVAINLSGQSLNDERFLEDISQQLWKHYQISPTHICFEITETAAVTHMAKARQFIRAMRRIGCRFALDDFGSGLSSFAYLKDFPVDFLKIDGTFVRDIDNVPLDRAIVEAAVNFGRVMGIPTIAEWVENETVLKHVEQLGVAYAQGWGISSPRMVE